MVGCELKDEPAGAKILDLLQGMPLALPDVGGNFRRKADSDLVKLILPDNPKLVAKHALLCHVRRHFE